MKPNDISNLANCSPTQSNEELSQFAYLASHDLKAPLRAITNLSTWIEEDIHAQLSDDGHQMFQLLRGRAHRLEKLIDALARYSQLGQQPLVLSDVDVEAVIHAVLSKHHQAKNFEFQLPAQMPVIQADHNYLTVIFQQLIDNAIRFHPAHAGTIQIKVQELESAWQFSVIDDGNGIAPQYHDRIFKVFQTLESRDRHETTGIGLAIVAKILQMVGGEITVLSSLGHGANFQFSWPKFSS